jgi:hypothetical protein
MARPCVRLAQDAPEGGGEGVTCAYALRKGHGMPTKRVVKNVGTPCRFRVIYRDTTFQKLRNTTVKAVTIEVISDGCRI